MTSPTYIPPEGAMQFEITQHFHPENIGSRLWVAEAPDWYVPAQRLPTCTCRRFFDVLWVDKTGTPFVGRPCKPMFVCECLGRIVE